MSEEIRAQDRLLSEDVVSGFHLATVHAALATIDLLGSGQKHEVDQAAVAALRDALSGLDVDGLVLVGEGEKDEAPMLHIGEKFGTGNGPSIDIAVDPVDGTRLAAENLPGSVAVLAVAERGALFDIGPAHYMEKLVTGAAGAKLSLDAPLADNLHELAGALGKPVSDLVVAVQDRPRNARYVADAQAAGARVDSFADGDVERCLRAARPGTDIDLLVGIGGAPEGILTAAAVRALGGSMQARLAPQGRREAARLRSAGLDTGRVLTLPELCSRDSWLFLTAITDCRVGTEGVLRGIHRDAGVVVTTSWIIGAGIRPLILVKRMAE
ncbi:fructose-bisphosphatase class II family protein [Mycetocola zhadangensis]|uniref:Fructose-1,6-bisphosphatase n=1 Tax=Mycetocola zhadangensis TaxID=1164595 RepID=A0A3L7J895_9MICO|nr:fructose-bisphosphatase class II [Mycetocola zhadangensis]RLQ85671.1 fructose-bisphosphatase class II family protein [Mycetocola zhadangensis]GGE84654.1 fructose-1,6-bisphosphatase [Mycetocola zhadangensis]